MDPAKSAKISKLIGDVARLDPVSIGVSIAAFSPDEQHSLEEALKLLYNQGSKRIKSEKTDDKAERRRREDAAFIERLRVRLNTIKPEKIDVAIDFNQLPKFLEEDIEQLSLEALSERLVHLISATTCLDTLKTMVIFRKGKIMERIIDNGWSKQDIANKFDLPQAYVDRVLNFTSFCETYPLLQYTGYSFETLIRHKTCIIRCADEDDNFRCKLQAAGYPRFHKTNCDSTERMETDKLDGEQWV